MRGCVIEFSAKIFRAIVNNKFCRYQTSIFGKNGGKGVVENAFLLRLLIRHFVHRVSSVVGHDHCVSS